MTSLWAFLLAIAILVGVHEYGHYKAAVAFGVRVLRFSLGFGPVVYRSRMGRKVQGEDQKLQGETEFVISLIPLGGYVTFLDESSDPSLKEDWSRAFHHQSLFRRSLIVLAGPMANFALAVVLLWTMNGVGFESAAPIVSTATKGTWVGQALIPSGSTVISAGVKGQSMQRIEAYPQFEKLVLNAWLSNQDIEIELQERARNTLDQNTAQDQNEVMSTKGTSNLKRHVDLPLSQLEWSTLAPQSPVGDPLQSAQSQRTDLEKAIQDNPKGVMAQLGFLGPFSLPVMGKINVGGPAAKAGLKEGDQVLQINENWVVDAYDLRARIASSAKSESEPIEPQNWRVLRQGESQPILLEVLPEKKIQGQQVIARIDAFVGRQPERVWYRQGPWEAFVTGSWTVMDWTQRTCISIYELVTGQAPIAQLGGPIALAKYAGDSVQMGFAAFLSYLALVSINLGVFNLLPIPPLDGGHLMAYAWQGLRGREMAESWRLGFQKFGLLFVLVLSVFALRNDLMRLFGLSP